MSKLTLSVDPAIISQAKRYAKRQGTSVSEMVETYLAAVSSPSSAAKPAPPILRSVRGSLKAANRQAYREHIETKYR